MSKMDAQIKSALRIALLLIGIGFVFVIYQYTITNPVVKAQITNFLTNTEPIVFGTLMIIAFVVYVKLTEKLEK